MCPERLEHYLREHAVAFQVQNHPTTYTAGEVATVEHIPGKMVAKSVIGFADGKTVMLVLPSTYLVDYKKAAHALEAAEFELANEEDLASLFPDCEIGAMPPFGNLYQMPVYVDTSLTTDETIVFPAGSHTETMSLHYADFAQLVQPAVLDFARRSEGYTT